MKILLYGINFAPEFIGIGKYTGELAAWLAALFCAPTAWAVARLSGGAVLRQHG